MKIAVGIPNSLAGTPGRVFTEWATLAEKCGFSSLGSIGRIAFDSHEELMTFAACAAVTRRIGFLTTVLLGPVRETALLAKQAATLDSLSGGRFKLGLGLGAREDDYTVTDTPFAQRGDQFEEQLKTLKAIWRGEHIRGIDAAVGPRPFTHGGPRVILSGRAEAPIKRAGRMADGFVATPVGPEGSQKQFELVKQAWKDRPGHPYLAGSCYFALGPDVQEQAEANVREYYAFGGEEFINTILDGLVRSPQQARELVEGMEQTDAEEFFFWPVVPHLDQLTKLSDCLAMTGSERAARR